MTATTAPAATAPVCGVCPDRATAAPATAAIVWPGRPTADAVCDHCRAEHAGAITAFHGTVTALALDATCTAAVDEDAVCGGPAVAVITWEAWGTVPAPEVDYVCAGCRAGDVAATVTAYCGTITTLPA